MTSVLVVDDEPRISRFISLSLRSAGLNPILASCGADALTRAREQNPVLILLDLGLPDMDGLDVFVRLREVTEAPVIMLTARGGCADKVKGLDLGADDYMVKPFDMEELLARVRAALRRAQSHAHGAQTVMQVGFLVIDTAAMQWRSGANQSI